MWSFSLYVNIRVRFDVAYITCQHGAIREGQQRSEKGKQGMRPENEQDFISLNQLQEILGIGRTKAYELVASGELPAIRVGRAIRVRRADLNRWAEHQSYIDSTRK
jgi:excisionase family DNA binding protein